MFNRIRTYSKRIGRRPSRRQKRYQGGQTPIPADVAQNIQDVVTRMKAMSLTQLNLEIASGLIKCMTGMTNPGSQPAFMPIFDTYALSAIPEYLKTNTPPAELTAFSSSVDISFAIFMLIIDKLAPIDNPQTVPTPTTIDSSISQKIGQIFSLVKIIRPAELKIQSEDAKTFMMSVHQQPSDIAAKFSARFQEISLQLFKELHSEFTKFTPDVLVSYPVWPLIVKETFFTVRENSAIHLLWIIGMKIIFESILQEIQNQGSSTTTGGPFTTTTGAPFTTTRVPSTTTGLPSTTTRAPSTTTRPPSTTTQPPLPIPAGIVAWLNANANKVPSNMVRNLNNAVSFIKLVFPTQTRPPLVQAAANKLIML